MDAIRAELIAPCGMNCRLCSAYQRKKARCSGCGEENGPKPDYCRKCLMRNCPTIENNATGFCYECTIFPCRRLKQLDKRYRTKYFMSMIENLTTIKQEGMASFLKKEEKRWTCPQCGGVVCVHKHGCLVCDTPFAKMHGAFDLSDG